MAVHILIALQLIAWTIYMVFSYLILDRDLPAQSLEGFLFLCAVAIILCFIPALRLAQKFEMQPFAFIVACLPIIAVATTLILQLI